MIKTQEDFFNKIIEIEQPNYKIGLDLLNEDEKKFIEKTRQKIIDLAKDKIHEIRVAEGWKYGAIRIKGIFHQAHNFALLPILYKDYKNYSGKKIKDIMTEESLNEYLLEKYPHLNISLRNITINYWDYRKELKKLQLSDKLGYGQDLPKENEVYPTFRLSLIAELVNHISSKTQIKMVRDEKVVDALKLGKKQQEIAQEFGISQGTISKIKQSKGNV